jgi:hypothetical protein
MSQDAAELDGGKDFALGNLVKAGYVSDPKTLFCPAFRRPPHDFGYYGAQANMIYWDTPSKDVTREDNDKGKDTWIFEFTGGIFGYLSRDNNPGNNWWRCIYSGVTTYGLGYADVNGNGTIDGSMQCYSPDNAETFLWHETTFTTIADKWDNYKASNLSFSPMVISCANYGEVLENVAHGGKGIGWSHNLTGVNGTFYDGSARWISDEEYPHDSPKGWWNTRFYHLDGPMQKWALQKHLTVQGP